MNLLPMETRVRIVHALAEGCSMRSASRLAGVSNNTVMKLLCDLGAACQRFHDEKVVRLRVDRIQANEVWSFGYVKEKNLPEAMRDTPGVGSVWTWTAIDSDAKLMLSWHVGDRDADNAREFMLDLAGRLLNRCQLTTNGLGAFPGAAWEAFGTDIDYAQLIKVYGPSREQEARYSPAECMGTIKSRVCGSPIPQDVSTSYIERSNLTLCMGNRRFTRLTNGFSKKFDNLCCSVALFFTYYNWCRVHKTLRVTPAMEAGLTDHVWEMEEFIGILEAEEAKQVGTIANKRGPYRKSKGSN